MSQQKKTCYLKFTLESGRLFIYHKIWRRRSSLKDENLWFLWLLEFSIVKFYRVSKVKLLCNSFILVVEPLKYFATSRYISRVQWWNITKSLSSIWQHFSWLLWWGDSKNMEEIEFSRWLLEGRPRQGKHVLPDGLNWLC